jgi:hypothetical protein
MTPIINLMKLGMTPERFEEVQAPIINAAVAGRDLITDPAAMANMAYKYPLEVGGTLAAFRLWSARVETSSAHLKLGIRMMGMSMFQIL